MMSVEMQYVNHDGCSIVVMQDDLGEQLYLVNLDDNTVNIIMDVWQLDYVLDDIDQNEFENCEINKMFFDNLVHYIEEDDEIDFDLERFKNEVNIV